MNITITIVPELRGDSQGVISIYQHSKSKHWNCNEDNLMFYFLIKKKEKNHYSYYGYYLYLCDKKNSVFQLSLLGISYLSGHLCWAPIFHTEIFSCRGANSTEEYKSKRGAIVQSWGISGWDNCFSLALPSVAHWPSCNSTPISSSTSSSLEVVVMLALQKSKPRKIQLLQPVYQNVSLPLTAVLCGIY